MIITSKKEFERKFLNGYRIYKLGKKEIIRIIRHVIRKQYQTQ